MGGKCLLIVYFNIKIARIFEYSGFIMKIFIRVNPIIDTNDSWAAETRLNR